MARLSSGGTELLAIDRDCEYRNSVTAAAAGAGAPVVEYRPRDGLLVLGYIEGRTFGAAGWTLWGAIQNAASPIDVEFWSWATERFEGAAAGFTAPGFAGLLEDVQRDD